MMYFLYSYLIFLLFSHFLIALFHDLDLDKHFERQFSSNLSLSVTEPDGSQRILELSRCYRSCQTDKYFCCISVVSKRLFRLLIPYFLERLPHPIMFKERR